MVCSFKFVMNHTIRGHLTYMSQCMPEVKIGLHMSMVSVDVLADMLQVRDCHSYAMMHVHGFPAKKEHDIIRVSYGNVAM